MSYMAILGKTPHIKGLRVCTKETTLLLLKCYASNQNRQFLSLWVFDVNVLFIFHFQKKAYLNLQHILRYSRPIKFKFGG